ncbi:leukosialin [Vombatus ursinus]|uniref:Sialophorin n=1 Tax=Vombatus ursinus TaxID=29139 RepID=A0A4X2LRH7_VOMUR|nr:leukosialin [Vombatus ursinus]
MVMVPPLSLLLLLILTEWASTDSIATSHSVQTSSSDSSFSVSHLTLKTTSSPASESSMVSMSSPAPEARPLTFLTTEARDSAPTIEVASATTLAPTVSGLTQVDKENPSSTQELATHASTLAVSVSDAVAMVTTPSSTHPPSDTPIKMEEADIAVQETTTLVIKETTHSKVISAYMTTSAMTSFQVPQTTSTSSISLTNESPANKLKQDGGNTLLVILVVVILVATVMVALFLLWRRRQKRRTGALMLVGSGKHKGAGDTWAGPVQGTEDQAASGSAAVEGGTGNAEGEGSGRRPTLTTFFGKRKSRQGSVMLEDLEAGAAINNLRDESEPLVENMNGVVKPPEADGSGADGSGAGDGSLPSAPVTEV